MRNYFPEKRKFSGILCFRRPPPPPPPCHNFVVSAITFEGYRLRSSNLTHALLIQISRTGSVIDIVVPFKMAAGGHFVKQILKKEFRMDLKWPDLSEYFGRVTQWLNLIFFPRNFSIIIEESVAPVDAAINLYNQFGIVQMGPESALITTLWHPQMWKRRYMWKVAKCEKKSTLNVKIDAICEKNNPKCEKNNLSRCVKYFDSKCVKIDTICANFILTLFVKI